MTNAIDFDHRRSREPTARGHGSRPRMRRAVYTVAEVSRLLSLSLGGTYELVRTGVIPGRKLGGRWVIPKRAFHAWLDSCTDNPDSGDQP